MTTEDMTPEALLKRAVEALNRAQADSDTNSGTSWDWVGVSQAAVGAGQLALDIRQAEPRSVVIDDLSGLGQALLDNVIEDPRVKASRQVWVNPDEWEILLALRTGAATVVPADPNRRMTPAEASQRVRDRLAGSMGTHDHPHDPATPDGDDA